MLNLYYNKYVINDKDKVLGWGDGASPVKEMKNSDRFVGLLCKPKTLQQ